MHRSKQRLYSITLVPRQVSLQALVREPRGVDVDHQLGLGRLQKAQYGSPQERRRYVERPHVAFARPGDGLRPNQVAPGVFTMNVPSRRFLYLAAGAAGLVARLRTAKAQAYPTGPVRIVVGFAPGINPDIIARLFAQSLSERFGQQFIVENRPGAASTIATEAVVRAPADGYTLLAMTSSNTVNATLYDRLSFNLVRDIAPVAGTVRLPSVMVVTPTFAAKTLPEFIAHAKANPGMLSMASPGTGTTAHVMGELFNAMTDIKLIHVPYRGSYVADLLAGQVQVVFSPVAQCIEYIKDGKMRALAVTGTTRSDALPDVPAIAEFVPGYEANVWDGIGAPRNTPRYIVEKLNKEINSILADPGMTARLALMGAEPMAITPAEFGKFIDDEIAKWAQVIKFARIKPE
jgi:tripartite-type tricarboxylate transporter receptor subunit TctC